MLGGARLSLPSGRGQTLHQIKQPLHLIGAEQVIGALRGDACERGLVDPSRFHDAVVGEVVDDEVDEGDLVLAVVLFVEEVVERLLGCRAVEAD